jgi:hypothetical protein
MYEPRSVAPLSWGISTSGEKAANETAGSVSATKAKTKLVFL